MAQGTVKKSAAGAGAAPARKPNSTGKTKKGARVAKPKKATSADKLQKQLSAGIAARTEKLLGERAGHLELIGKGRDRSQKKAGEKKPQQGGSRKFG